MKKIYIIVIIVIIVILVLFLLGIISGVKKEFLPETKDCEKPCPENSICLNKVCLSKDDKNSYTYPMGDPRYYNIPAIVVAVISLLSIIIYKLYKVFNV